MFLIKAGTVLQIEKSKPTKESNYYDTVRWMPYTTKEDKIYDKEEVWDRIAVYNGRDDIPMWAIANIREHGYVIIKRNGKYAMCKPNQIQYLN